MTVLTFDTHEFVTTLKKAGFVEEQAEAVVNTVKKAQTESDLATKADLNRVANDLRHEMRELEHRLTIRLGGMLVIAVGVLAVLIKIL